MMRITKILAVGSLLVIVAAALISGCGDKSTSNPPVVQDSWTILNYGDGNNNLDYAQGGNSYVIEDVQEMQQVGSSDQVNVVAMVSSITTGGNAKYYYVEHYPDDLGDNLSSTVLEDLGGKDMSSHQILKEFLVYGISHYPADHYMVIIDDHGGGWRGACEDSQNGSGNMMSMVDMKTAFRAAAQEAGISKFDIITYHCCLMSQVEVAYQLRDCADYVVGSEFVMPMESVFGCPEWLGALTANPSRTPEELAKSIVTAVDNSGRSKQKSVHMAATRCSQMARLASKIDHLGTQLTTTATDYWVEVLQAWFNTWSTELDDPTFVDIRDFANNIKQQPNLQNINLVRDAADSVIAAINDAVVMTKTNVPGVTRGGLTIYMPYLAEQFDSSNYGRLDFAAVGWSNFLITYIQALEPYIQQYNLTVTVSPGGSGTVAVNPNQSTFYAGDQVTLTATAGNGYQFNHFSDGANNFPDNPFTFTFPAGDVGITAYFSPTGGGNTATISGNVSWPGHTLSNFTVAYADSVSGQSLYLVAEGTVNPANGNYTVTIANMTGTIQIVMEAQDDVNNDSPWNPNTGDGWGYYDGNQDGQWNDFITVSPGDNITGVNIEMSTW